jgi:hypothetical protein
MTGPSENVKPAGSSLKAIPSRPIRNIVGPGEEMGRWWLVALINVVLVIILQSRQEAAAREAEQAARVEELEKKADDPNVHVRERLEARKAARLLGSRKV